MKDKVELLIEQLQSDDLNKCDNASIELGEIRDQRAVKPLMDLIKREPRAGWFAIRALGFIGDKRAIALLGSIAKEDEFLQNVAKQALKDIEDAEFPESWEYLKQGNAFAESGDYLKAEEYYKKAIEDHPRFSEALCNLGIVYSKLGKERDSVASYKLFLESVDDVFISHWVPFFYRAKKAINGFEGVDADVAINLMMEHFEQYRIDWNTPGGGNYESLKDYLLCIFDVGYIRTEESRAALAKIKAYGCDAEIAMAVELALKE